MARTDYITVKLLPANSIGSIKAEVELRLRWRSPDAPRDQDKVEVKAKVEIAISSRTEESGSMMAAISSARIASAPPIRPSAQAGVAADQRLGVGQKVDQGWHERRVAGITCGDARVARRTSPFAWRAAPVSHEIDRENRRHPRPAVRTTRFFADLTPQQAGRDQPAQNDILDRPWKSMRWLH